MSNGRGTFTPDGSKIKKLRRAKAWTQNILAEKAGVERKTVYNLERNKDAQRSTLDLVAQALEVEIKEIIVSEIEVAKNVPKQSNFNKYLRDFSTFINERTNEFTGRNFVFDAVDNFIAKNDRGYFFIKGDPGIGKSSIASQLVIRGDYIHHFNILAEGRNKPRQFLENICSRLILDYRLDYEDLPMDELDDGELLRKLLHEVAGQTKPSEKVIIVIDALDEVDEAAIPGGANILYLPVNLPEDIYIIATTRPEKLNLRIDCVQGEYTINPDSNENRKDIEEHIRSKTKNEGIRTYIKKQKLTKNSFVEHMKEKSAGNFMYLHYVLPEIEKGDYKDINLSRLPVGLQNYYEDHWRRMGMMASPLPKWKIQVIYVLTELYKPVSRKLLAECCKLDEIKVQEILDEWEQFLHSSMIENTARYSPYHTSFTDFLHRKEVVQAAGVTIKGINRRIAEWLYGESNGE